MATDTSTWTKVRPTEPGIYKIRGFNLFRSAELQREAVVEIRMLGDELCSNIHEVNSAEFDEGSWYAISSHADTFEYQGPFVLQSDLATTRTALAAAEKDAERLNWLEAQFADGIHVEKCTYVAPNGYSIRGIATVFVGRPQSEFKRPTIREAIDAARAEDRQEKV